MTGVGLLGIFLSFLAIPFATMERTRGRMAIFMLALVAHLATAVIYYLWVQTNTADTILYYYDPYEMYRDPVRPGTLFVVHMTQTLRGLIGGSYLDYFLIFQAFGFWGLVFLMRTIEEIYVELGLPQPRIAYLVLFLPGLHFWSSAIGKDAFLFLGASLALWSTMRLRSRLIPFAIAVLVMTLFRPHIALVATIALAVAAFFDPKARGYVKVFLFVIAMGAAGIVAGSVQSSFSVDVTSAESLGEFFSRQSETTQKISGTTAVTGASYPVRLLSLLFRPMFLDAQGAFGLIASLENVFIIIVLATLFRNFGQLMRMIRQVFFIRFAAVFAVILIVLLSMVYYNVGLGLRQKIMFMPALLTMFVAVLAVRRSEARAPALSYA
jgi:hypothetical protein